MSIDGNPDIGSLTWRWIIDAPASAASKEASAISSGVTGRCGVWLRVVWLPVTAQVIIVDTSATLSMHAPIVNQPQRKFGNWRTCQILKTCRFEQSPQVPNRSVPHRQSRGTATWFVASSGSSDLAKSTAKRRYRHINSTLHDRLCAPYSSFVRARRISRLSIFGILSLPPFPG
jgi:hypothetical protein